MTICEACRKLPLELFTANHDGFYLHPSLTSLLASASAGCKFCLFLQRRLGIDSGDVLPEPSRILLYTTGGYSICQMACQINESTRRMTLLEQLLGPRRHFASFQFAVEPFGGNRRSIMDDTRSEETFQQIEKWLHECDAGHLKCKP